MITKYYSEELDKYFDTEKECIEEETKHKKDVERLDLEAKLTEAYKHYYFLLTKMNSLDKSFDRDSFESDIECEVDFPKEKEEDDYETKNPFFFDKKSPCYLCKANCDSCTCRMCKDEEVKNKKSILDDIFNSIFNFSGKK